MLACKKKGLVILYAEGNRNCSSHAPRKCSPVHTQETRDCYIKQLGKKHRRYLNESYRREEDVNILLDCFVSVGFVVCSVGEGIS